MPLRNSGLVNGNIVDAQATAGNASAKRRKRALLRQAGEKGMIASSATQVVMMNMRPVAAANPNTADQLQKNLQLKEALRLDLTELRDVIADDQWPVEIIVTDENGQDVTVTLHSRRDADALANALEQRLQATSDTGQMENVQVQGAVSRHQAALQMVSNQMKTMHDTAKAIIANLKA